MGQPTYTLLTPTDIRLNGISAEVGSDDIASKDIQAVIAAMTRIAQGERSPEHPDLPSMVGLAAPQIGVCKRIILIDFGATADRSNFNLDLHFVINPRIVSVSSSEELGREGCYSAGDIGGAVYRATSVTIEGADERGNAIRYELQSMLARIAQHEIDHLNGVRFPDRVRSPEHLHALDFHSDEFQTYRENWQNWTKLYPLEQWLKIKAGTRV